jgi:hypothetical protein
MTPRRLKVLIVCAIAFELASWGLLLGRSPLALQAITFTIAHGGACLLLSVILHRFLPARLRGPRAPVLWFLFSLSFFIPLVGFAGLALCLLLALYWPRRPEAVRPWITTDIPPLPFHPLSQHEQPIFGDDYLIGVLRNVRDPERRLKAVMATRQLTDLLAIPVLQVALKDPVDDVRLLAYAIADAKERTLYGRIKAGTAHLSDAEGDARALLQQRLAQDYWELAYLGLAQGEVLTHVLTAAMENINAALLHMPRAPGLHLLRGRILLRTGQLDAARAALDAAEACGLPRQAIAPHLAEVAYRQRRFSDVRDHLAELPPSARAQAPLLQLYRYWCAPADLDADREAA